MNVFDLFLLATAAGLLFSKSLNHSIVLLGLEGMLLGAVEFFSGPPAWSTALIALATVAVKVTLIPGILWRLARSLPTNARTEQPLPLWAFAAALAAVLGTGHIIQMLEPSRLVLDVMAFFCALCTVWLGMVMVVARRHLLSQVTALVSIENGLMLVGVSLAGSLPGFIELGILADLAAAVTILAWMSHRIHAELRTTDVVALQSLKG